MLTIRSRCLTAPAHLLIASLEERPVGLLLYELNSEGVGQLLGAYVRPEVEAQGIEQELLKALHLALRMEGARGAEMVFKENEEWARCLEGAGWRPAKEVGVLMEFEAQEFNPSWMQRTREERVIPWGELPEEVREAIDRRARQGTYPPRLSPSKVEPHLPTSFALWEEGEVKGWVLTEKLDAHTLLYKSFYILPPYRPTRLWVPLLQAAIAAQQAGPLRWAILTLNPGGTLPGWTRFCQKRLVPDAQQILNLFYSSIVFKYK